MRRLLEEGRGRTEKGTEEKGTEGVGIGLWGQEWQKRKRKMGGG